MADEFEDMYELDGAMTHGDAVTCETEIIVENPSGNQMAGRGVFCWDADDPLVAGIHFEVMTNSLLVTPEHFPMDDMPDDCEPDECYVPCCMHCGDGVHYGSIGALIPHPTEPDTGMLYCLMCADTHHATEMEESLWMIGLLELEGATVDQEPAEVGAASVRVWRKDEDNFVVALHEGTMLALLTMPLERLTLFLEAVKQHPRYSEDETESYFVGGLTALENLANEGIS